MPFPTAVGVETVSAAATAIAGPSEQFESVHSIANNVFACIKEFFRIYSLLENKKSFLACFSGIESNQNRPQLV